MTLHRVIVTNNLISGNCVLPEQELSSVEAYPSIHMYHQLQPWVIWRFCSTFKGVGRHSCATLNQLLLPQKSFCKTRNELNVTRQLTEYASVSSNIQGFQRSLTVEDPSPPINHMQSAYLGSVLHIKSVANCSVQPPVGPNKRIQQTMTNSSMVIKHF